MNGLRPFLLRDGLRPFWLQRAVTTAGGGT